MYIYIYTYIRVSVRVALWAPARMDACWRVAVTIAVAVGVIPKNASLTFWPGFFNSNNSLINRVQIKDIGALGLFSSAHNSDVRRASHCYSRLAWGAIF